MVGRKNIDEFVEESLTDIEKKNPLQIRFLEAETALCVLDCSRLSITKLNEGLGKE